MAETHLAYQMVKIELKWYMRYKWYFKKREEEEEEGENVRRKVFET